MSSAPAVTQSSVGANWAVPYYVKGLALGVPVYLVAIHMWTWVLVVPNVLARGGYDFRQLYAAASMVRTGHASELYEYASQRDAQNRLVSPEALALPFVSPAYEALIVAPFTFFSYRTAYCLFLALNSAALGICFFLLRPWMSNLRVVYSWLPAALFLGFLPVATALVEGQDSILVTALLAGAFRLLTKGRAFWAGILIGIGLFKFPISLPIAMLFLLWRRWHVLLGFTIIASIMVSLSVWVTGVGQARLYVESLIAIIGVKGAGATNTLALYPVKWQGMANVHGFVAGIAGDRLPKLWVQAVAITLSAAALGWTAIAGRRLKDESSLLLFSIPCSVLVGYHTNAYDLSVVLVPIIVLLNCFLPSEAQGSTKQRLVGRAAALMFVAPVMESYSLNHFYVVCLPLLSLLVAIAGAPQFDGLNRPA
jgi:hypothetical protein